jgi:lysophospholipase L1-like esterase
MRLRSWSSTAILVLAVAAGCTGGPNTVASGPDTATAAPETPTPSGSVPHFSLVAIGDSLAHPSSCDGCTDFPHLYARAITKATGVQVDVHNDTAIQFSNEPAVQATQLYANLLTDPSLREDVAGADIVLVNVGFNDTPWNRLDNPCDASDVTATKVTWSKIDQACIDRVTSEYKQALDEIFTEINELRGCWTPVGEPTSCAERGHNDTMLRLVTVYNDWIGWKDAPEAAFRPTERADAAFVAAQCWVVKMHGGQCADVYHVLNGPQGNRDAGHYLVKDHTHLNQAGHQMVANTLATLGFAPLKP